MGTLETENMETVMKGKRKILYLLFVAHFCVFCDGHAGGDGVYYSNYGLWFFSMIDY